MVSLFFIIFLAVTIFFGAKCKKGLKGNKDKSFFCFLAACITGGVSLILLIFVSILINKVGTAYIVDIKIAMYEEENASIEESIDEKVRSYMEFEANTYGELKDKDAINIVFLFPKLQSDTLVQKQVEVYIQNREAIKQLKEKRIDLLKSKWLLYFGR